MKIYLSHSGNYDYDTELYAPLKLSQIAQEHQIFFPHDKENNGTKSKDIIKASDLVIAEVSYPATGEGIELGWADAYETPILCLYSSGAKISSSLKFISKDFIVYENKADMIRKLENWLMQEQTDKGPLPPNDTLYP
jgi:hypothetical protein